jgi:hypothetical protein
MSASSESGHGHSCAALFTAFSRDFFGGEAWTAFYNGRKGKNGE